MYTLSGHFKRYCLFFLKNYHQGVLSEADLRALHQFVIYLGNFSSVYVLSVCYNERRIKEDLYEADRKDKAHSQ
jgi:hypothetical protein